MQTSKIISYALIVIAISLLIFSVRHTNKLSKIYDTNKYNSSFKGIILKKVRRRGNIVFYRNLLTYEEGEIYASSELQDNSVVGDTIIKIAKSNKCILKSKSKQLIVKCYFDLDNAVIDSTDSAEIFSR